MGWLDDVFAPVKKVAEEAVKGINSVGSAVNQGVGSTLTGANQFLNRGISDISNGLNYNLDQFGRQIDKGISGYAKNVERGVGDTFSNLAYGVKTGNYNPFVRSGLTLGTGINPDDLGKSGAELMQEAATQNQANQMAMMTQAREKARIDTVNSYIDNIISKRLSMSDSNKKMNLLGGTSGSSILTISKGG
jgi:hypothetical protein